MTGKRQSSDAAKISDAAKAFLQEELDLNYVDQVRGFKPLYAASYFMGHKETLEFLLAEEATLTPRSIKKVQ